jgi:hypothetical protein
MRTFQLWALSLASIVTVGIVAVAVWQSWKYVPILGEVILVSVGVFFLIGIGIGTLYLIRLFYHSEVIPVEQFGVYLHRFGKVTPLPPLNTVTPKQIAAKVTELASDTFPRLGDLIVEGSLFKESETGVEMFQGFREDGTRRYGSWPGVIAVAGGQNVGKSVTLLSLVIVALLQGARIVVCDVHWSKSRSLYKKLESLTGLVTFAKSYDEVAREASAFSEELAARKRGSEPYPYLFVLDEAASVIKRSEVGEQVCSVIEQASQEGHGYNLSVMLACHDWSKDGLGDVRIRSYVNFVYNHRMSPDMSKFIFSDRKHRNRIASLPAGHVLARDEYSQVEYLVMPMGDTPDTLLARKMIENGKALPSYNPVQVERPVHGNNPSAYPFAAMPELPMKAPACDERERASVPVYSPASEWDMSEQENETFRFASDSFDRNTGKIERISETKRFVSPDGTPETEIRATRKSEIIRLRQLNCNQSVIIQAVYGIRPGDSPKYHAALSEYKAILAEIVRGK